MKNKGFSINGGAIQPWLLLLGLLLVALVLFGLIIVQGTNKTSAERLLSELVARPEPDLSPTANSTAFDEPEFTGPHLSSFIENVGQVNEKVEFYHKTGNQTLWFTPEGLVFDLLKTKEGVERSETQPDSALELQGLSLGDQKTSASNNMERLVFEETFPGANKNPRIESIDPQPGTYNYFTGDDASNWFTDVKAYSQLIYQEVWEGIDLKFFRNGPVLEQEFIVKPGAEVSSIQVAFRGIEGLEVDREGSLLIKTAFGKFKENTPYIYQELNGERIEIEGNYRLLGETSYTFEVASYHPDYALVIDPTLNYSTYLGGSLYDIGRDIVVDVEGNAYITGNTSSLDFPTTPGAYDSTLSDFTWSTSFVTKMDSEGSNLIYSTFLGGNGRDEPGGIDVDTGGNAYVVGSTFSTDFPTTPGSFQPTLAGGLWDAFVTKLNPDGSALIYSSYLGGSIGDEDPNKGPGHDFGSDIAVDHAGNAYVTGETRSFDFPLQDPIQDTYGGGFRDTFITKINATGSTIIYSTFLGGSGDEGPGGVDVASAGNIFVSGNTASVDFPVLNAFQPALAGGGGGDAFVAKLNPAGNAFIYATYLGSSNNGNAEYSSRIVSNTDGSAYVTGSTSGDFPATPGAFQTTCRGSDDAFVAKFDSLGSLIYATCLGGGGGDSGLDIEADANGNVYITGVAGSTSLDFPITADAFQPNKSGLTDAFMIKLDPTGSFLVYSTFLGGSEYDWGNGIAVDAEGNAYVTGETVSTDFPTTESAFDRSFNSEASNLFDAFVAKFTIRDYLLTVNVTGAGSGTVSSSPAGINCGSDCEESYPGGTTITLTAASDPGSTFTGWSGPCSGTGSCMVNITTDSTVTANFDLAPSNTSLWIEPPEATLPMSTTFTVDVMVADVSNLFGVELELTFDPAIVEVVDYDAGTTGVQIEPGACPAPDFVVQNEADNASGTIRYATTSLSPSPPCDGGGVVASITFHGLVEGSSPVHFNSWLLSDTDLNPIPVSSTADGTLNVLASGIIEGTVDIQGRSDESGAEVCAWQGGVEFECTTTDATGYYSFSLPGGTYDVFVEMVRYLDAEKAGQVVVAGGTTNLCQVIVLGGDVNDDDVINILDLSFMGFRFGLNTGDPNWDERADINNDGTINILDIVGAGANYDETSPVPWLCP